MIDLQELCDHIILVHITLWMTVAKNSIFPDDINKKYQYCANFLMLEQLVSRWHDVVKTG